MGRVCVVFKKRLASGGFTGGWLGTSHLESVCVGRWAQCEMPSAREKSSLYRQPDRPDQRGRSRCAAIGRDGNRSSGIGRPRSATHFPASLAARRGVERCREENNIIYETIFIIMVPSSPENWALFLWNDSHSAVFKMDGFKMSCLHRRQ